jgi:hypothetical protein
MTVARDRLAVGELSQSAINDYQAAKKFLSTETKLLSVPIRLLSPEHFTSTRQLLAASGRRPKTQKNIITSIKAIMNWGRKMGLYEEVINYGPDFAAPSTTAIEAEQEESGAVRFFDRELILAALKIADAKMKVVILLGVNCAFYSSGHGSNRLRPCTSRCPDPLSRLPAG